MASLVSSTFRGSILGRFVRLCFFAVSSVRLFFVDDCVVLHCDHFLVVSSKLCVSFHEAVYSWLVQQTRSLLNQWMVPFLFAFPFLWNIGRQEIGNIKTSLWHFPPKNFNTKSCKRFSIEIRKLAFAVFEILSLTKIASRFTCASEAVFVSVVLDKFDIVNVHFSTWKKNIWCVTWIGEIDGTTIQQMTKSQRL